MTEKQLKLIYADARSAVGRVPDKAQSFAWLAVLGSFDEADVRAALVTWWGDTEPVSFGAGFRTKGSMMPAASDLKAMVVETLRKRREARRFKPCGRNGCYNGQKKVQVDGKEWADIVDCECKVAWERANGKAVAA